MEEDTHQLQVNQARACFLLEWIILQTLETAAVQTDGFLHSFLELRNSPSSLTSVTFSHFPETGTQRMEPRHTATARDEAAARDSILSAASPLRGRAQSAPPPGRTKQRRQRRRPSYLRRAGWETRHLRRSAPPSVLPASAARHRTGPACCSPLLPPPPPCFQHSGGPRGGARSVGSLFSDRSGQNGSAALPRMLEFH